MCQFWPFHFTSKIGGFYVKILPNHDLSILTFSFDEKKSEDLTVKNSTKSQCFNLHLFISRENSLFWKITIVGKINFSWRGIGSQFDFFSRPPWTTQNPGANLSPSPSPGNSWVYAWKKAKLTKRIRTSRLKPFRRTSQWLCSYWNPKTKVTIYWTIHSILICWTHT